MRFINKYPDAVRRGTCEQMLLSGVKTDHDGTLAPGAEVFCAIKQARHIQAVANHGYVHELTHDPQRNQQ